MIILLTAPYSGTHFAANVLRLLDADFAFCHSHKWYTDKIPGWMAEGHKLMIATRNPRNVLFSALNRRRDEERKDTRQDTLTEQSIMAQALRRIQRQTNAFEQHGGYHLRVDIPPIDPAIEVAAIAAYCDVPVTQEAIDFTSDWPITGSVKYDQIETPVDLSVIDENMTKDLGTRLGYSEILDWKDDKGETPRSGPTREDLFDILFPNRVHMRLKPYA